MSATKDNECVNAIMASLASVPYGKVCSYGKISSISGYPGKARYVAYLLKNLPDNSSIPWHRIINAQGKIAFPKDSAQYLKQQTLLNDEGIPMPLGRSSLKQYSWPKD